MNFIDAFFVDDNFFQNKLYRDCQVSIKKIIKIPLEEILKSDEDVCQVKRKDTFQKHTSNKENEKPIHFSEGNVKQINFSSENHEKNKNRKLPQGTLTKMNNREIKLEKKGHKKVLENKIEREISLSAENHEKCKTSEPSQTFNATSPITTLRRSSRLQQAPKIKSFLNFSRYGKYVECDNEMKNANNKMDNTVMIKKKGKDSQNAQNFKANTINKKAEITKNTIPENIDFKNSLRSLTVVCEKIDEIKVPENSLPRKVNKKKNLTKSHKSNIRNTPERIMTTRSPLRSNTTTANNTISCVKNDDTLTQEGKKSSQTKSIPKKSFSVIPVKENELANKQKLIKKSSQTKAEESNTSPAEKKSYKKASKVTTLKYLKERQKFFKENLNKDKLEEFPLMKKNKALEDLMKMTADETLTFKTPKLKNKQNIMRGITPRSDLIGELGRALSTSKLITPKDTSKSKAKSKEDGALQVLYKHLDTKKSRKRKNTNQINLNTKITKVSSDQPSLFKDFREESEWLSSLSKKPDEDKEETSFDDYFNQSV